MVEVRGDDPRVELRTVLIRDLVERYPSLMPVLAANGFDLCCGGGHTIPDAARLHGLDADVILKRAHDALDLTIPTT